MAWLVSHLRRSSRRTLTVAAIVTWACVALARVALATPITSAANAPSSGISPGGVDMATGEIIIVARPDIFIDGPMPLTFSRYYASMLAREGLASGHMGPNWLGTYDWKLNVSGTTADVITNEGADIKFQMPPAGGPWNLVSPLDNAYALTFSGGTYHFTDPVVRRVLTFSGGTPQLTLITDEHGNSLTLTYTGPTLTQVSDGLGRMLSFSYDPFAGMLTSITDGTRGVSYSYTGGTLTGFTDAAGHAWTYSYLSPSPFAALITGAGEPAGNTPVQNAFDGSGRVITQTDAVGGTAHYAWDAPSGNLLTDPFGRAWMYVHDAQNHLISLTDPSSQAWSRAYDASGRLASETRPLGDVTSYSYDAAGNLLSAGFGDGSVFHWTYGTFTVGGAMLSDILSIQFPDLTTESFTRDAAGNPTDVVDQAGFHWLGTYNARGQVLSATNPAGGVTQYSYDTMGRPISVSDPAGNLTHYAYDAFSRLITLAPDDTSSESWTYDALDHVMSATDERGKTSSYAYDANGRMTGATDPLGEATHYSYDGLDRFTQVSDPLGNATMFAYDPGGNMASITDGTSRATSYFYSVWGDFAGMSDPTGAGWTYSYDANRRMTHAQDPVGHSASFVYDSVDRPTHLTDPAGTGFDYGYDAMNRLQTERGPLGFSRTYAYDARGLMTSAMNATSEYDYARNSLGGVSQFTDPNRNASPYSYDSQGRLTGFADPLGRPTSYSYDARSRLMHATLPVNSESFMYDGADRLVGRSFTDGTTLSYGYDDANRTISGNGAAFSYDAAGRMTSSNGLALSYDAAGRITSETYGPGRVVSYSYDARGALSQVTDWVGGVTTFSYDISGNLTGITRPNLIQTTLTRDATEVVVDFLEGDPDKPIISSGGITRDALEQPTAVERSAPLAPGVAAGTTNFSYDAGSQVTGLTWDGQGRLMGDGSRTLVWDGDSRLKQYTAPSESQSLTYDGFGHLLTRTQGSTSEQYQWNYANDPPTLDVVMSGGSPVRYFIHTPSGLLLESIEFTGAGRHYYHYDENGNTMFLTDDTGAVTASYAYGPYGSVHSTGATANNPFSLGGAGGTIQLGSGGLFLLSGGGIYDTQYARMISGGADASGGGGLQDPTSIGSGLTLSSDAPIALNGGTTLANINSPLNSSLNSGFNSSFNFASRLMEEEGIFHFFEHEGGKHVLNNGVHGLGVSDLTVAVPPSSDALLSATAGAVVHEIGHNLGLNHGGSGGGGGGGHGINATMYLADMLGMGNSRSKAFEISSFSFAVENPSTIHSGGGEGKAKFSEFTITKKTDASSGELYKNCCAGSHYKTVTIEMRKAGGSDKSANIYLTYKFNSVYVTGIHWSGGGDGMPTETVSFQYGAVEIQYTPQKSTSPSSVQSAHLKSSAVSIPRCPTCPY